VLFPEFADEMIDVDEVRLRVRIGGSGPPVLLVHGHPRTGATWHRVAPRLVEAGFTVVCPDMRGYGRSSKPAIRDDHAQQSKRTVAYDLVRLMELLGHSRYAVAGHDRGCYVAMRLALDHPDRVERLAVLDGVPIVEAVDRCDATFAQRWYHWFFFAQPNAPERVINADPLAWYRLDPHAVGEENHAEVVEAVRNPETVRAMLEDYRAGLTLDLAADRADQEAGRRIGCPTLFCWSTGDDLELLYGDPAQIWAAWADDLTSRPIESGHHMAEENPAALAQVLIDFLPA
jgi:haloacetate dehalogenase